MGKLLDLSETQWCGVVWCGVGGATSHTRRLWQFFFLSPKTHTHTQQQNTADRRRFVSKTRDEEVGQERRKKRERERERREKSHPMNPFEMPPCRNTSNGVVGSGSPAAGCKEIKGRSS
jgi:hypothetical protein